MAYFQFAILNFLSLNVHVIINLTGTVLKCILVVKLFKYTYTFYHQNHAGRFLVFTCLLLFGILLSFRLEGVIDGSYWGVFVPLWFWKFAMIAGCAVGIRSYISQQVFLYFMIYTRKIQAIKWSFQISNATVDCDYWGYCKTFSVR